MGSHQRIIFLVIIYQEAQEYLIKDDTINVLIGTNSYCPALGA
jgi:hypothetical protein